jgi:hypothetical protein
MKLHEIKIVLNNDLISDEIKERLVVNIIAQDDKVIPLILEMLNSERSLNKELILDQNAELSRALIVLSDSNLKWNKKIIADPKWVVSQIKEHYLKWKDNIGCCLKINGLP